MILRVWISAQTTLACQADVVRVQPTFNIGPESDHSVRISMIRSRPLLTRAAKTQLNTELNSPIPAERKVQFGHVDTYVAKATITNEEQGIDAGIQTVHS